MRTCGIFNPQASGETPDDKDLAMLTNLFEARIKGDRQYIYNQAKYQRSPGKCLVLILLFTYANLPKKLKPLMRKALPKLSIQICAVQTY